MPYGRLINSSVFYVEVPKAGSTTVKSAFGVFSAPRFRMVEVAVAVRIESERPLREALALGQRVALLAEEAGRSERIVY